jgi:hypothetical protein
MALLLKAQAPGDPIVRPPPASSVSQAAMEERRNNMGPRRRALLVSSPDSVSRAIVARMARMLDSDRYQVATAEAPLSQSGNESLDSLAAAGGHEIVAFAQASQRRDSVWQASVRLRDLTAHMSYANQGASRRISPDSMALAIDSLAANAVRRVTTMDRAPRSTAVDPEVRAFQERAANMGPPRRIVIWNPPSARQPARAGSRFGGDGRASQCLTRVAAIHPGPRVTPRSTCWCGSRNRETVMSALKADLMVSIQSCCESRAQQDSVSWTISVRDLGAAPQYQERSFRSSPAPISKPFAYIAATLSRVMEAIEQMDAAPRRRSGS